MRMKDPNAETVGSLEQKLGFPPGTFRNPNGRDTRSDKKIDTIRKEWRRRQKCLAKQQTKPAKPAVLPMTRDLFSDLDLFAQAS
jgi:hypothetical protein